MSTRDSNLPHVAEGERPSAAHQNRLIDIANRQITGTRIVDNPGAIIVAPDARQLWQNASLEWVRNGSGGDLTAHSIIGLDEHQYDPTNSEELARFKAYGRMKGVAPTWPEHDGKFGVYTYNVAEDVDGVAIIGGLARCQVTIAEGEEWYEYADIAKTGTATGALVSLPIGFARILHPQKSERVAGTVWAQVDLGHTAADFTLLGKADEEIAVDDSGVVSLWFTDAGDWSEDSTYNVTAYLSPLATEAVTADRWVSVTWMHRYRRWVIPC